MNRLRPLTLNPSFALWVILCLIGTSFQLSFATEAESEAPQVSPATEEVNPPKPTEEVSKKSEKITPQLEGLNAEVSEANRRPAGKRPRQSIVKQIEGLACGAFLAALIFYPVSCILQEPVISEAPEETLIEESTTSQETWNNWWEDVHPEDNPLQAIQELTQNQDLQKHIAFLTQDTDSLWHMNTKNMHTFFKSQFSSEELIKIIESQPHPSPGPFHVPQYSLTPQGKTIDILKDMGNFENFFRHHANEKLKHHIIRLAIQKHSLQFLERMQQSSYLQQTLTWRQFTRSLTEPSQLNDDEEEILYLSEY